MSATPKPLTQSKTFWANLLALAVAALALPEVAGVIPPEWMPYLLALSAALNIVLRTVTNQPIGKPPEGGRET